MERHSPIQSQALPLPQQRRRWEAPRQSCSSSENPEQSREGAWSHPGPPRPPRSWPSSYEARRGLACSVDLGCYSQLASHRRQGDGVPGWALNLAPVSSLGPCQQFKCPGPSGTKALSRGDHFPPILSCDSVTR